jgi:hypothetical protein
MSVNVYQTIRRHNPAYIVIFNVTTVKTSNPTSAYFNKFTATSQGDLFRKVNSSRLHGCLIETGVVSLPLPCNGSTRYGIYIAISRIICTFLKSFSLLTRNSLLTVKVFRTTRTTCLSVFRILFEVSNFLKIYQNIVSCLGDYRRGLDW